MPTDNYILAGLVLGAVVVAVMAVMGTLVGFQTGRRASQKLAGQGTDQQGQSRQIPERLVRELQYCLDVADCVSRDADALSAVSSSPTAPIPREVDNALSQLRKTVKGLTARLEQVSHEPLARTDEALKAVVSPPATPASPPADTSSNDAPANRSSKRPEDLRKFPRKACPGSFKATIYPPPHKPEAEPVQCTVLIRDLSCGGVGIAHTEQLYPRQIVVLHAVTKLLIGEVRWCRQVGEQSYIAGCQLVKAGG